MIDLGNGWHLDLILGVWVTLVFVVVLVPPFLLWKWAHR